MCCLAVPLTLIKCSFNCYRLRPSQESHQAKQGQSHAQRAQDTLPRYFPPKLYRQRHVFLRVTCTEEAIKVWQDPTPTPKTNEHAPPTPTRPSSRRLFLQRPRPRRIQDPPTLLGLTILQNNAQQQHSIIMSIDPNKELFDGGGPSAPAPASAPPPPGAVSDDDGSHREAMEREIEGGGGEEGEGTLHLSVSFVGESHLQIMVPRRRST